MVRKSLHALFACIHAHLTSHIVSPPQVALGAAHDSNLGWALADVQAAETAEAAQPA